MASPALAEAKKAWGRAYEGLSPDEVTRRVRGFSALIRGIADRGVVSPASFATELGVALSEARELLSALAVIGLEVDEAGNVLGAALTTTRTPHEVQVNDRSLYAWCALDTLFIPGLLGETAEITSHCVASGQPVQLVVSPTGIDSAPDGVAVSVVLPTPGGKIGPASPT